MPAPDSLPFFHHSKLGAKFTSLIFLYYLLTSTLAAAESIPVSVQSLDQIAIYPEHEAPATVISLNDSRLSAEISATISEIPVKVGNVVEAGAVLVKLDNTDYALAVKRLEAMLKALSAKRSLAHTQLERAQTLLAQGFVNQDHLDQRKTEADSLDAEWELQQAALASAQRDLDKCIVRAPYKALIMERLGQVGEFATPGKPLLRLLDLDHVEVSAQVQSQDLAYIRSAGNLRFIYQEQSYPLKLRAIIPAVDPLTRNQEVRLEFTGKRPLAGTAGRLLWKQAQAHIPPELLVRRQNQLGVFIAEENKARFIALPGALAGRPAPVKLPVKSKIITDGRHRLQDGDTISVGP